MTYTVFFILTMSVSALMGFLIHAILSMNKVIRLEEENLQLYWYLDETLKILGAIIKRIGR